MSNFRRVFGNLVSPVPLSYLDDNFSQLETGGTSTVSISGAALVQYIQPGSGAVSRGVQSRLQEIASIVDFGADPTGASDSSAAIQAAVDSLPSRGGCIFAPFGTYLLGSTISITKSVVITGVGNSLAGFQQFPTLIGPTCFLKKSTLSGDAFNTSGANGYIGFENFHLDAQAGSGGDGIRIGTSNTWVRNVTITNMGQDGIRVCPNVNGDLADVWRLDNVWSKGNGRYGYYIHDDVTVSTYESSGGVATNIMAQSNTSDGIRVGQSSGNAFFGGFSEQNTALALRVISGCTGCYFFGIGIQEGNNGGSSNTQMQIDSGAEDCLFVAMGTSRNVVTNNGTRINFLYAYGRDANGGTVLDQPTLFTSQDIAIRRSHSTGSALVTGDFLANASWGSTASVSSVAGSDQAFQANVTSGGSGIAANPTITFTYHDGSWSQAPFVVANWHEPVGNVSGACGVSLDTASVVITLFGLTPTAGRIYTVTGFSQGNRGS